jgi:adenylate kinase family enzyme
VPEEHDNIEGRLSRVVVQGNSGSGKTTFAGALANALDIAYLELDGLYQQRDWTPLDIDEFRARVATFADEPRWIVDGNYSHVRDILWPRATTVLIIDLPKRVVITRVIKRTILRILKREELWNGNRESWRNALSRDPNRNIILWSWNSHAKYHDLVPREAREAVGAERVVVLSDARSVRRFLEAVGTHQ